MIMIELSTLCDAKEHVLSPESNGFLELGCRNRLWDELLTVDYENGPFRRTVLSLLAAQEAIPKWQKLDDVPDEFCHLPMDILRYCRRYMAGEIEFRDVSCFR